MTRDFFIRVLVALVFFGIFAGALLSIRKTSHQTTILRKTPAPTTRVKNTFPLAIESEREKTYPGSDLIIEQELEPGSNYKQYIASYKSEGLKIYGLLTVPQEDVPEKGFPAIIFNHGYIPPKQYSSTGQYVAYLDGFATSGFVVFKPDFRGNGNSEGTPEGPYYSPAYTTDVLNALASVKKLSYVNKDKIGMWGHSMGGNITLRTLVISKDIKAAVIWSGVVGSYEDLFFRWHPAIRHTASDQAIDAHLSDIRRELVALYGEPNESSEFWKSIDPYTYLPNVTARVQLHQGLADDTVPPLFSEHLKQELEKNGKTVEYYTYEGADHNLSQSFSEAENRSVDFFNKFLK